MRKAPANLIVLIAGLLCATGHAATITVNTTADEWNTGSSTCSTREALDRIRQGSNGSGCTATGTYGVNDTINIPIGTYTLTRAGAGREYGDLDVERNVTLQGGGGSAEGTVISASGLAGTDYDTNVIEVLEEVAGVPVTAVFTDIQFQEGRTNEWLRGAGIQNNGTLTLNRCAVVANAGSAEAAGGIGNDGSLTINASFVSANSNAVAYVGSGADNNGGAVVVLNSTFGANLGAGPGVYHFNYGAASMAVTYSTFDGNPLAFHAQNGVASAAATIFNGSCSFGGSGSLTPGSSYNTDSDIGCDLSPTTNNQSDITVALASATYNGGTTLNYAIDTAGVAYNRIPSGTLGCGGSVSMDQRGATRPSASGGDPLDCDIGAFEIDPNFTLASVASFQTLLTENGTVLQWETDSEVGTLGYALDRQGGSGWEPVANGVVPAAGPAGGSYRVLDPAGLALGYRLRELEANAVRIHGPYYPAGELATHATLEMAATHGVTPRAPNRPCRKASGKGSCGQKWGHCGTQALPSSADCRGQECCSPAPQEAQNLFAVPQDSGIGPIPQLQEAAVVPGDRMQIAVEAEGLYRVSSGEIASHLGMTEANAHRLARQGRLRLTNKDELVPWLTLGGDLYFYGQALDSPFTRHNVYWLRQGRGQRMDVTQAARVRPQPGQSAPHLASFEEDRVAYTSIATDMDSDYWYWAELLGGSAGMDRQALELGTPGATGAGDTLVTFHLRGVAFPGYGTEYAFEVTLNGIWVGTLEWSGAGPVERELPIPSKLLRDGTNQLELTALAAEGDAPLFVLDRIEARYERAFRAVGGRLALEHPGYPAVTISGLPDGRVLVLEISEPDAPVRILRPRVDSADNAYRVSFAADPEGSYLVASRESALAPSWMRAVGGTPELPLHAEYLIVAPEDLLESAQGLVAWRESEGLTTAAVSLESIYDQVNFGIASPHAVKGYIERLYDEGDGWLRYVALIGQGSFDYRDLLGFGDSMVPPWMVTTEVGLFASDLAYGDVDGSGVPKVLVGRIPVAGAEGLAAYLAKLSARASQGTEVLLWAVDDPDEAGDFPGAMHALADLVPEAIPDARVDLSELGLTDARSALFEGWNAGASTVMYLGHGSVLRLAHEGLMTSHDVAELSGEANYPVFTALSCVVNRFGLPGYEALGETLAIAKGAGAVASFAPAALSRHGGATLLGRALIRAVYGHGAVRLGDALLLALEEYRGTGADPVLLRTYNLLGDPTVKVETAFPEPGLLDEPLTQPPPVPDPPVDDGQPPAPRSENERRQTH